MGERCIACAELMLIGQAYFLDVGGGVIHADCCGPERESYAHLDGEPLEPDEPIPTPLIWSAEDDA